MNFREIAARLDSRDQAFEELSCQLARRTVSPDASFVRLHGAGGDGGVECFADFPDDGRVGWQAKYVFDVDSLLRRAKESLETAVEVHPNLRRYVVCFPFDLTGPTKRGGRSGQEKFQAWQKDEEEKAARDNRRLTIEPWPASKLRDLLLQHDASGGIRAYFFNERILTPEWFREHLALVKATAGPRYTPALNVETDLWQWFAAFGRTDEWSQAFKDKLEACRGPLETFSSAVKGGSPDQSFPSWPAELLEDSRFLQTDMAATVEELRRSMASSNRDQHRESVNRLDDLLARLSDLETALVADLEAQHQEGADSPRFRQFMAEYMVSFPAANLDATRDAMGAFSDLRAWIGSPACSLAHEPIFVISGVAGSGKTHGICDAADSRASSALVTCVTFGHQFRGEPDPWTRLSESLGLTITDSVQGLLDALEAAGEASGFPLILCIDAINETRPLSYWGGRLAAFCQAVRDRGHLRLAISCRTSFLQYCLPDDHGLPVVEHRGFAGKERDACAEFFGHYDLKPPIAPILPPEFANPLYLRLVCETLRARGLSQLPRGWHGIAGTIRAFIGEKERRFASEHATSEGANRVGGSLRVIARAIAQSADVALPWSEAIQAVAAAGYGGDASIVEWLVREDLLIEDAPHGDGPFGEESVVRPAFERLGDFLVASETYESSKRMGLEVACQVGNALHSLWSDGDALQQNRGVLEALAVVVPEESTGLELPDLAGGISTRDDLMKISVGSLPSRDPSTFTSSTCGLISRALGRESLSFDAMDALLSVSWYPSCIDGIWLDGVLKRQGLAKRDAYWCAYLHSRFECDGVVQRLISAAFELPLSEIESEIAERWSSALSWLNAAADRRVADGATRALTTVLAARPSTIPSVLGRVMECDDDQVRERVLLSSYGALILSRDAEVVGLVTGILQDAYRDNSGKFDSALIRDHIKCIGALAVELKALPEGCDPDLTLESLDSAWPLELPSEEDVESWSRVARFRPDEFASDFFKYSMSCLRCWEHGLSRKNMGEWILQRVVRDFVFEGSGCEEYDAYMLGKYGPGRSKPVWAERIGKKYQWIAMYQLVSRLHDHLERRSWYDPSSGPVSSPLILREGRKMDPTLPPDVGGRKAKGVSWWSEASPDLDRGGVLSDEDWIASREGVPALEDLVGVVDRCGQDWRLLVSYPSWEGPKREGSYRQIWTQVQSYLVRAGDQEEMFECLRGRNFFGRWMPEGGSFLGCFPGEYPWGAPFGNVSGDWTARGQVGERTLPVPVCPSWNEMLGEWEYDSCMSESLPVLVPARPFFALGDLWWDGQGGYRGSEDRTVLRDPSVTEGGAGALIGDAEELGPRLGRLGMCLIWTLVGEKGVVGVDRSVETPVLVFSQVARLGPDGLVEFSERVFFDQYDLDQGPKVRDASDG